MLVLSLSANAAAATLYHAVEQLDSEGVWGLLALARNCNELCPVRKVSALVGAVFKRNVEMVALLLAAREIGDECDYSLGFNLDTQNDPEADVPLEQYFPVAKVARATSILINAQCAGGMTALHHAAQVQ